MERTDAPRLTVALKRLCGAFSRPFTEDLFDGYLAALVDVPIDLVEVNALSALRAGERMPLPRDLRAGETAAESPEARALLAWTDVRQRIRSRIPTADPVAAAIVEHFGGLHRMGEMPSDEVHGFMRREFVKLYAQRARDLALEQAKVQVREMLGTHQLELPA